MKKLAAFLCLFFLAACSSPYVMNNQIVDNAVENKTQVVYVPSANYWNKGAMADDRIVFTKHITSGSGSYSEYASAKDTLSLPTTYEFLYDGRLIGYNEHDLKFYEVIYKKGKFTTITLTPKQVHDIFPGLDIVTTSSAKNGVITIEKPVFEDMTFLLLNDTDVSYYHYSFEEFKNTAGSPFKGMIKVKDTDALLFSHFESTAPEYPVLKIKIKDTI